MDAVITISEFSRQMLIKHLGIPGERVITIYSGNDHNLFRPIADARAKLGTRYGLSDSVKYLLYVGTESPRKNMALLLQVLQILPRNICLIKVGGAGVKKFREHTQKLIAQYELSDRVLFFDHVSEQDLPIFYSAADVYVCASFLEGFGHPIVEAMSCGTPIVCSNVASLPEITHGAAILIPPENAKRFAEAVQLVLEDDTRRERMRYCGLHRAAEFSWERTAEAVVAVYRQLKGCT
jgi:glycosyltransferase involved in cell wall biosynthesis